MTLASDATEDPKSSVVDMHWATACQLVGEYDVQADYRLLEWPAANGTQATLTSYGGAPNAGISAVRDSRSWAEEYGSWIPNDFVAVTTADSSGRLRIQRTGTTGTVSYMRDGVWIPIASGPTVAAPSVMTLGLGSAMNIFIHQEVKVAWDNFRVNAGTFDCPTWWEDDSPDWQPLPG